MILAATGLTKRWGANRDYLAVDSAYLEVAAGEFVTIIGRSGSGKSTLLAMLGALTRPNEGQVTVDGQNIWSLSETELAVFRSTQVGFIFQFPSLLPNLRAIDNVALPALLANTMDPEAAYARAMYLLESVGLLERAQSFPGQLSGGEQRRVVIARALINSPRFLLADEPTSDLDEDSEADVIDLLDRIRKRQSVGLIMVAHDPRIAQRSDRAFEMCQGVLAAAHLAQPSEFALANVRHFGPRSAGLDLDPVPEAVAQVEATHLGHGFWRIAERAMAFLALLFLLVLTTDYGVGQYEQMRLRQVRETKSALETMALAGLRGDVQTVQDRGDGRYELTLYLWNVAGGKPIYVMSGGVQVYVQVDTGWQELSVKPVEESANSVLEITGKQMYRYEFEAKPARFTELLPHYMHVRFVNNMLVSPRSRPKDDLFERKDSYYVYLKPWNVEDKTILQAMKFDGKPPVWIPMPPH